MTPIRPIREADISIGDCRTITVYALLRYPPEVTAVAADAIRAQFGSNGQAGSSINPLPIQPFVTCELLFLHKPSNRGTLSTATQLPLSQSLTSMIRISYGFSLVTTGDDADASLRSATKPSEVFLTTAQPNPSAHAYATLEDVVIRIKRQTVILLDHLRQTCCIFLPPTTNTQAPWCEFVTRRSTPKSFVGT